MDSKFSKNLPQKLITEFLGTLFLTMTVKLSAGSSDFAPFAIGTVLMVWVYLGGNISGGQYNPAVALGVFVRYWRERDDQFRVGDFGLYVFTQLMGGICGGLCSLLVAETVVEGVDPGLQYPEPQKGSPLYRAFFAELFYTSLLVYTVLSLATSSNRLLTNNQYFGACIGFTVVIGAISIGPVSGGSMNPAVWLGCVTSAVVRASDQNQEIHPKGAWIYWVAPILAGLVCGGLYRYIDTANARESIGGAVTFQHQLSGGHMDEKPDHEKTDAEKPEDVDMAVIVGGSS